MKRVSLAIVLACLVAGCDHFLTDEARIERARLAAQTGEYGRALVELRRVVQNSPEDMELRLELARYADMAGEDLLVVREVEAVLALVADHPEATQLLANALLRSGQAAELLRRVDSGELKLQGHTRRAARARALLSLGEIEEASRELEAVRTAAGLSSENEVLLAEVDAAAGALDDALARLERVLESDPLAFDAWLAKARIEANRGHFERAESSFAKALESPAPRLPLRARATALAGLTETALAQGDTNRAAANVNRLHEAAPGSVVARFLSARVALAQGEYTDGVGQLQRLIRDAPHYVPARLLLATAHLIQGNYNQAEQQLNDAIQRAPHNIEARKLLARVRLQLDRPEDAIVTLDPAAAESSPDPEIAALLSTAQARAGDQAAALDTLERYVRQHPQDMHAKVQLSAALLAADRAEEAADLLAGLPATAGGLERVALEITAVREARGPAAAQRRIETFLENNPADADISLVAGVYYAAQREFGRARALLRAAAEAKDATARAFLGLAKLELMAGEPVAAESWARRATEAAPQDSNAWLTLSELQFRRRDFPAARQSLEKARATAPQSLAPRLALSRVLFTQGDTVAAEKLLDEITAASPRDAKLLSAIGDLLRSVQRHDQALAYYRRAIDLDPRNGTLWLAMGDVQLAMDATGPARESFERARTLLPDAIAPAAALAMLDVRVGQPQRALARVAELKQRSSGNAALHVLEGDVQAARKEFSAAADAYAAAERLEPSAATALKLFDARRQARLAAPQAPLERWLEAHPEDMPVRLVLAQWLLQAGRLEEARIEFETIVRNEGASAAALNNLAWIYQQRGDSRARATAERAREIAPHLPAIADTLGWILLQEGEHERALPLLREAAAAMPDDADVNYHLAAALAAAGRDKEALTLLRKVLGTSASFPARGEAQTLLDRLVAKERT